MSPGIPQGESKALPDVASLPTPPPPAPQAQVSSQTTLPPLPGTRLYPRSSVDTCWVPELQDEEQARVTG